MKKASLILIGVLALAASAFTTEARRESAPEAEKLTIVMNADVDIINHYGPFALVNEVSVKSVDAVHCFCNPYKWHTDPPFWGQWGAICVENANVTYYYGAGGSPDFCSYCPQLPC